MKASVLINNYNYESYIDECLNSVLNQTYENIEIIFFDDSSTDNSLQIAKKYLSKNQLIENRNPKEKFNSHNQFNAITKAFQKSTGDIIFLLDSDDYFLKLKVEKIMNLYDLNPSVKSIQDSITNLISGEIGKPNKYLSSNIKFNPLDFVKETNLIYGLGPQTSGMSFRREYFIELINEYNIHLPLIWPDIQLGRKALFENNAMVLNKSYTIRRIHNLGDSTKLQNKSTMGFFLAQYSTWLNYEFNTDLDLTYSSNNKLLAIIKTLIYFLKNVNLNGIYLMCKYLKK